MQESQEIEVKKVAQNQKESIRYDNLYQEKDRDAIRERIQYG
jgi:hypothetical protein